MNLYICHTAYQVLIDLVRASRTAGAHHELVLSAKVPEAQALAQRLRATGVVTPILVREDAWPGIATGFLGQQRNRRGFEKRCGWHLQPDRYAEIFIHNDWSVLGRYLQDCRAAYTLCEDTFASTIGPDQSLVEAQRRQPDFAKKQRSGKGYLYWGDSRYCKKVESEDPARCILFGA